MVGPLVTGDGGYTVISCSDVRIKKKTQKASTTTSKTKNQKQERKEGKKVGIFGDFFLFFSSFFLFSFCSFSFCSFWLQNHNGVRTRKKCQNSHNDQAKQLKAF